MGLIRCNGNLQRLGWDKTMFVGANTLAYYAKKVYFIHAYMKRLENCVLVQNTLAYFDKLRFKEFYRFWR